GTTKPEAQKLLQQGRQQLAQNKFDEATQTAQRLKAMNHLSWGLFEDSPDSLLVDVQKARLKRDRAEAGRVLAEARRLYEKGDYEAASRAAYRAEKLHGPYSIWDLGDRPSKLLSDISTARAKTRKTAVPPPVLVKRNESKFDKPPDPEGVAR